MRDGRVIELTNNKACNPSEHTAHNLDLQYGLGEGLPELRDWLVNHMRKVHKPKYDDWTSKSQSLFTFGKVVTHVLFQLAAGISVGSTDATFKLLALLDSGNKKIVCDQYTVCERFVFD